MAARSLEDYCSAAHDLIQRDQCKEAIVICRRILLRHPLHVRAYTILGEACLAIGEHAEAANLFRRVLGADPENAIAYAGLGVIYEERGLLEEATWQMERAFELTPYNAGVRATLSGLYAQLDVTPRRRLKLTRAALARCYARGRLYPKAIGELREIVQDEPDRVDLRVSLAEALWHDEQYEAADAVCQGILNLASNCLKANLILGEICLRDKKREDQGRAHLERAQRLDPENRVAQQVFGDRSPLPPRIVPLIPRKELKEEPLPLPEELLPGERLATVEDLLRSGETKAPAEPLVPSKEEPAGVTEALEEAPTIEGTTPRAEPSLPPSDLPTPLEEEIEILQAEKLSVLAEEVSPVAVMEEVHTRGAELALPAEGVDKELIESTGLLVEEPASETILEEIEILPEEEVLLTAPIEAAPRKVEEGREESEREQVYAAYLDRIKGDPADYPARLELARAYGQDERGEEALAQYAELIRSRSGLLTEATEDLEALIESFPRYRRARELLGDAYLEADRFSDALESYQSLLGAAEQGSEERPESEAS